ncbi:BDNF/NT-3 growth factors receptor [Octopus bimaculoides]|nr:BDNF/NT-3 growth factors receptor [Octopus bimaculoides]|eukprot:XP_014782314.1 PREDICTED: BDNF/NT-3 growth factors receptor-like [Octopus bimaculoides]
MEEGLTYRNQNSMTANASLPQNDTIMADDSSNYNNNNTEVRRTSQQYNAGYTKGNSCETYSCNVAVCRKNGNTTQCYCTQDLQWLNDTSPCQMSALEHVPGSSKDAITAKQLIELIRSDSDNLIGKSNPPAKHPLYYTLQITIPVVILGLIIILCLLLLLRKYHRKHYKVSHKSVLKSADSMQLFDRLNVINKNPNYLSSCSESLPNKKFFTKEIPLNSVKLLELVGEGAFGQVFRGEMFTNEDQPPTTVAVKVLKNDVSNKVKEDFEREVEITSSFDHDNILKLLGIIIHDIRETPYMVFEYMTHGDLAQVLRKNDPHVKIGETSVKLTKVELIDIATQIACGMNYLSSQHFVHRDLATRNCLVGDSLTVKISDFGLSRDIYTCDYYRIGGSRMLPVRWMAPESVKYGRFTSESDVWSYGVVLWEIFSYGKQPYFGHSNEEVVTFINSGITLEKPEWCPPTIYNIMSGCWKQDPRDRLTLKTIYKHLIDYSHSLIRNVHIQPSVDWDSERIYLI